MMKCIFLYYELANLLMPWSILKLNKERLINRHSLLIICFFPLCFLLSSNLTAKTQGVEKSKGEFPKECFLVLVGKDMTTDGSVLISHNEDDWYGVSSRLVRVPKQTHLTKNINLNYVSIPQVKETNAYWAQGISVTDASEKKDGSWVLNGMNENGVIITSNSMHGSKETTFANGITRYDIRQLVLERAKNAKEGVLLIAKLIDEHKLSGDAVAFAIADPKEIWLVEATHRHWVAKKIRDDSYYIEPNHFTIGPDWDLASSDIISYAKEQGWYSNDDGKFSFRAAYSDPEVLQDIFDLARIYQAQRILDNYNKTKKISVSTLKHIVTQPPIMDHRNQATFIWHLRSDLPAGIGCKMWFCYNGAGINAMAPIYLASHRVPESYTDSPSTYSPDYPYWQARLLQVNMNPWTWVFDDNYMINRLDLNNFQKEADVRTSTIEREATTLYNKGRSTEAIELLSSHTYNELNRIFNETNRMIKKFNLKWKD